MIYCIDIQINRSEVEETGKIASHLASLDETFTYRITEVDGEPHLLIYNARPRQAKARAEWLTTKTKTLHGKPYSITVNNRPKIKEMISLQEMDNTKNLKSS